MKLPIVVTLLGAASVLALSTAALSQAPPEGSRYFGLPRYYKSEISVSEAYLAMEHSKGFREMSSEPKPVLIDNRSLREYASGHPADAYNVPYPTVSGLGGDAPQDPLKLYWEVYRVVRGRMDTPIMTLCRTGIRSVLAGNILANPESNDATKGQGLQPFTNVRNIWEGFVGQPKYAFETNSPLLKLGTDCPSGCQLDLNKDGFVSADAADVYTQTKDANPDKDGWRNFAGLPWTSQIRVRLAYERDVSHYTALNLTAVP
jgi:rhodanese-related sulfurtransferase